MVTVDVSDAIELVLAEGARIRTDAADRVLEACKEDCPVSPVTETNPISGTLRDSLTIVDATDDGTIFGISIESSLIYAQWTDEVDTAPHEIRAVRAPMLRFWWENGPRGPDIYFYKRVWHPGTKGQHWFASKNADRWDAALAEVASS